MIENYNGYFVNLRNISFISPIKYNKAKDEHYVFFRIDGENITIASSKDIEVVRQQRDIFLSKWKGSFRGQRGDIPDARYRL